MSKIRKSAQGEDCTLQIHPYCNGNPETTVLCHIASPSKGIGRKSEDFFAVLGCSDCHDIIDKRRYVDLSDTEILECILRALHRTWLIHIDKELITVV